MKTKVLWGALFAMLQASAALIVASFAPKENSDSVVLAFGLSAITWAILSSRE